MKWTRPGPLVVVALCGLYPAQGVQGYPVTWQFAGQVTFLDDDDNLLGGAVGLDGPWLGKEAAAVAWAATKWPLGSRA